MQVFIANIDLISKNPDDYSGLLSVKHQKHLAKFQNQNRKLQFVLGHLMADKVGKRYVSIAHKDNWVVVATASNVPVGIDIENTTIKRDFVTAAEIMNIGTPKTLDDFYKLFTEYEATYKLGTDAVYRQFITFGDYLICITSNHEFAPQHLHRFNIKSILISEKK